MKTKLNSAIFCCLTIILSLTACNDDNPSTQREQQDHRKSDLRKTKRIAKDKIDINLEDAGIVASLFNQQNKRTRSENSNIRNIVTLIDANGNPSIYAVNFEDGYMLISATKKYYPVLAIIDHGSFSLNDIPGGEKILIDEMMTKIDSNRQSLPDSIATRIAHEWRHFEESPTPEFLVYSPATRYDFNRLTDEEYQEIYDTFDIENEERKALYFLKDCKGILPEEVYNEYLLRAEGHTDDLYGGTKHCWQNTAIVVVRYDYEQDILGNFLQTKWDQYYTESLYAPILGCVTVATGQLMRYYQYPATFNWSAMPSNQCTTTTSEFLLRLRRELNVDENNASTLNDAVRVLQSYGYNCRKISHNANLVEGSLRQKNPVIQRGNEQGAQYGHAWVCDGYSFFKDYDCYELYCLGYSDWTHDIGYTHVQGEDYRVYYDRGTEFFHMNWGWGGSHDGWYLDDLSDSHYSTQFTQNRQEIIINGHN